jgi:hypothetical protein
MIGYNIDTGGFMGYTLESIEQDIILGLERGDDMSRLQRFVDEVYKIRFKSIPLSPPPLGVSVLHLLRTEE